jgi:hypothetical protein
VIQSASSSRPGLPNGRSCELRVGSEVFELAGGDGRLTVKARPAAQPDAVVTIKPELLYRLASGRVSASRALAQVASEGDPGVAREVIEMLGGSVR